MNQKRLTIENLNKGPRSYIDCLYALLTSAGLFNHPKYILSGMTGMALNSIYIRGFFPAPLICIPGRMRIGKPLISLAYTMKPIPVRLIMPPSPYTKGKCCKKLSPQ